MRLFLSIWVVAICCSPCFRAITVQTELDEASPSQGRNDPPRSGADLARKKTRDKFRRMIHQPQEDDFNHLRILPGVHPNFQPHIGFVDDHHREPTRHDDDLLPAASVKPINKPSMHKVSLTQVGYIQFLRYVVPIPELHQFSFCVWLRSKNLTHNHPILSYSKDEKERLARAWLSPSGHHSAKLQLRVREHLVFTEPVPEATHRRWVHICPSWDGETGRWDLYVDGRHRRSGIRQKLAGLTLPSGGDVVLGQEYTDFDKGLDDGVEGDVFGFYLFKTASPRHDLQLQEANNDYIRRISHDEYDGRDFLQRVPPRVQHLYALCKEPLPFQDKRDVIVSWTRTPVRVFGGAIIKTIHGECGNL